MSKKADKTKYYLGNPNLPAADAQIAYEPWMIKEIEKVRDNILYFAENFFFIINLDRGREKIKLHPCQKRVIRKMRDNRFFILLASRQIGKALALDTPIPTPSGWTTMGELKDGDKVYGLNGKQCNVVKAHDVLYDRECYKVTFDNGEEIVADSEHLWFTQTRDDRRHNISGSVKTTRDILNTINTHGEEPNHRIPTCITGVDGVHKQLPISPYVLGLWLGDGASAGGSITVGSRDIKEVLERLQNDKQFDKLIVKEYRTKVFTLRPTVHTGVKTKSLSALLKQSNLLKNKHIPEEYLLSSREQRLELLRGLIDSDGYITKTGICQFYNTNKILVDQVRQLVESLGYKVTEKEYIPKLNGVECSPAKSITFTPIEDVCYLSFKKARIKHRDKQNNTKLRAQWHYIKRVELIQSQPVRCITVDSDDNLFLAGRHYIPTHNSTLMTIYMLWYACFMDDQRILLVANKEATAIEIFQRVRLAFEELPEWLKPGVKEYGKTSMTLDNGSRIGITTTTGTAARGQSVNLLIIDECAFIEPHLVEEFWKSVFPIITSSKKSKVFICSTANGTGNLFHQLYDGAEKGENGWGHDKIMWDEVPGRDEKWAATTKQAIGSVEAWLQEFNCIFINSGESSIDEALFLEMSQKCTEPKIVLDEGNYKIWEEPDPSRLYVAGVDISEGVGIDASVIQILDITDIRDIKQVAVYHNRHIPPLEFANKVYTILRNWGSPLALIERNNCGAQVVDRLAFDMGYEKVVSYGAKTANRAKPQMGMIAHTNTKYKGVMNMRYFINEMRSVTIQDLDTLKELKDFIRYPNGTWKAKGGYHDDRVMSLIYALYILEKELTERYFEILELDDHGKPCAIEPMDFGISMFEDATSIYNDFEVVGINNVNMTPIVFGMGQSDQVSEIEWLEQEGWTIYG